MWPKSLGKNGQTVIHPGRLTWNLIKSPLEDDFSSSTTIIFRFYVNVQGCITSEMISSIPEPWDVGTAPSQSLPSLQKSIKLLNQPHLNSRNNKNRNINASQRPLITKHIPCRFSETQLIETYRWIWTPPPPAKSHHQRRATSTQPPCASLGVRAETGSRMAMVLATQGVFFGVKKTIGTHNKAAPGHPSNKAAFPILQPRPTS